MTRRQVFWKSLHEGAALVFALAALIGLWAATDGGTTGAARTTAATLSIHGE